MSSSYILFVIDANINERMSNVLRECAQAAKLECKTFSGPVDEFSSITFKQQNNFPAILIFFTSKLSPLQNFQSDYSVTIDFLRTRSDIVGFFKTICERVLPGIGFGFELKTNPSQELEQSRMLPEHQETTINDEEKNYQGVF